MNNEIKSEKLFIKQIFDRWYKIPNYQRPYVWGKDQITELLDDISFACNQNENAEYFLGSIVFQTIKDDKGNYVEDDVLDGQQRLTTLFLLIASLRDLTENKNLRETCEKIIFQHENEFDGTPERIRIIYDIRDVVKRFVDDFIKPLNSTSNDSSLTQELDRVDDVSVKNMINAILVIKEYFNSSKNITPETFFKYLNNKVIMIYVASESLEDSFRMFTILNNRGIKLRNSDILKAENLRLIRESDQAKYAKDWEQIENYFKEDFDVFLSHVRTIIVKEKARLNLYDEYQKNIYNPKKFDKENKVYINQSALLQPGKDTVELLLKYKNHYDDIFNSDNYSKFSSYGFDNLISIMQNVLPADFWVPPLLRFYDKFGHSNIMIFLELLDNKFSYDWIIGETPTTRIENMNNIIKVIDECPKTDVSKIIQNECFKIKSSELINVLSNDIYGRRYARYILFKLDYILGNTDKINVPQIITVEHILPQNPAADSTWMQSFNESERESLTNKIGNLVLISRRKNSSQGRLDFHKKKERYFKNNIELFRNSVRIFNKFNEWSPDIIEQNSKYVINLIENHYEKNNF